MGTGLADDHYRRRRRAVLTGEPRDGADFAPRRRHRGAAAEKRGGTFSKSFASLGGFVAGKAEVIDFVKHHSRSLIFSASITPASAASALAALDVIEGEPDRRERHWHNVAYMHKGFSDLGYNVEETRSPIIPIHTGGDQETFRFWRALLDEGVYTNPVVSPAVPPGEGLIRTSYMATHADEDLDRVLDVFARIGVAAGLVRVA